MRHLTFCGRKLLIFPAIALALLAATVDAHAATPAIILGRTAAWTGNTGSTLCTGAPIFSDYNQPGNCKFTGTGSGLFTGQFKTPATVVDPSLCPQQAVDSTDVICGHFGMDFSNVQGTVTVGIGFNGDNDLDLCAIDSAGALVNECSVGSGATESVTFNVKCADTRYEAQILPISYLSTGPTPVSPATYTGTATGSLAKCFPGGSDGQGNGKRQNFDHHGKGKGHGKNGNNHDDENVSSSVDERNNDADHRGKVRYTQPKHASHYSFLTTKAATGLYTDGCDLRSTQIDSTTWNDLTQTMVVTGYGTVNGLGNAPFVFTETDNGPGTSDTYSVDSTCSGSGNLTDGSDFTYTHEPPAIPLATVVSIVPLGTADSFAVLAGSAITNTGPTTIFGDLGTFPTPTITGIASLTMNGTNHGGDAVTQTAKTDLVTAYTAAAALTPTTTIGTVDIGGKTLAPGVYNSGSSIGLTGTVTLDAGGDPNAVFVFQAGSTLTTASASRVVLTNGAQAANVFWQVGSSATLGTYSTLQGSILALTSITVTTGVTIDGRVLARNGAVTMDSDTITQP
ncbi:MAG: hypothetical protein QOE91_1788 [Gaiellaceae bacterium]|nr:hypothetical protein [Gaiellaceae bacterium]